MCIAHAGILPGSGYEPSDKWYGLQAVYRLSMGNWVSALGGLVRIKQPHRRSLLRISGISRAMRTLFHQPEYGLIRPASNCSAMGRRAYIV